MTELSRHLPPGPYSYMTTAKAGDHDGKGVCHVLDGNGRKVAVLWGSPNEKLALAELIIDAMDSANVKA
jgi:hypothetical protein